MAKSKIKPYTQTVKDLMDKKTYVLTKAHALSDIGMKEITQPLWASAAAYEEQIAPLLDALGRDLEAAVHRISAASCYQKAGDLSRAANLFQAALAGPLRDDTRRDVEKMLADCLAQLHPPAKPVTCVVGGRQRWRCECPRYESMPICIRRY